MQKQNVFTQYKNKCAAVCLGGIMLLATVFGLSFGNAVSASAAGYQAVTVNPLANGGDPNIVQFLFADYIFDSLNIDLGTFTMFYEVNGIKISYPIVANQDEYASNSYGPNTQLYSKYHNGDSSVLVVHLGGMRYWTTYGPNSTINSALKALNSVNTIVFYFVIDGVDYRSQPVYLKIDGKGLCSFVEVVTQLPPDPVKDGYNFSGWYYDENFNTPYGGETITSDVSLYAKFTPINYGITYNLNGGNLSDQQTNYNIESATYTLPTPSKTGYAFGGWFENSGLSGSAVTQIVNGSMGNKTYYAKWTAVSYGITYNLNGGTLSGQQTAYTIESGAYTLPAPTRTGYTFGGWFENSGLTGTAVTTIPSGSTGDKAYYVKWTVITYTITYSLNNGTLSGQQTAYTIESAAYTLPTPTLTGYTFKGWFENAAFTGSAIASIATGSTGNKAYFAKWEIITYKVTFYVDGEVYREMNVNHGTVLSNYMFLDSQMAAVSFYSDPTQSTAYNADMPITGNTIIYAEPAFADIYATLTYNVRGALTTETLAYNSPLVNLRTYEYEDYNFGGWYYDEDFIKPVLETDKLTKNTVIYAKLTEIVPLTFWERVGAWFGSAVGIVVMVFVAAVIAIGGICYAVFRKKKA